MKIKLGLAIVMLMMVGMVRADVKMVTITLINNTDEELQVKEHPNSNPIATIPKNGQEQVTAPSYARLFVPSGAWTAMESVYCYNNHTCEITKDGRWLRAKIVSKTRKMK